ncbi:hypothetical protein ASPZODRAFT_133200, partial [Penicilliopsis zonata CBS 506.65]
MEGNINIQSAIKTPREIEQEHPEMDSRAKMCCTATLSQSAPPSFAAPGEPIQG